MNTDFPRILTLLRKEKNLSQKQAALELGISQALLSHYEKGIRECGLDFVVKVAEYYNVSCDYLLGRTPDRNGAKIDVNDIPDTTLKEVSAVQNGSLLPSLHKKLIYNSLSIIYDILEKAGNKPLNTEVSIYLMTSVYEIFRILYSANSKNPQAVFSVNSDMQQALALSVHIVAEANARRLLSEKHTISGGITLQEVLAMTPEFLSENYPQLASSLYNLIQITESAMKQGS